MSIQEHLKKINLSGIARRTHPTAWPETLTTSLIIILVAFGSFGLGRLSRIEQLKTPLVVKGINGADTQVASVPSSCGDGKMGINIKSITQKTGEADNITIPNEGFIVGSKTGKKYHFPWCAGAQRIKEENKIWFANEVEAQAAGYTPAANCRGLAQ